MWSIGLDINQRTSASRILDENGKVVKQLQTDKSDLAGWPWVVSHPTMYASWPQIGTCAPNAYGASDDGFAMLRCSE